MSEEWLAAGEEVLGSWSAYLGDPRPNSAKVTGKLHVTSLGVHFAAQTVLAENAAAMIGNWWERHKALAKVDDRLMIPYAEIEQARTVKKSLFLKALAIRMKSGEEIEFQFGAASPEKAVQAISGKL